MSIDSEPIHPQTTILVVEDDVLNMKLFRTMLILAGYDVIEAGDAEKGLEYIQARHPGLIIMDIQLPGMSGVEAIKILKADESTRSIPVIAVTGYAMSEDRERCFSAGCDAYLTKPLDRTIFLQTVHEYLESAI